MSINIIQNQDQYIISFRYDYEIKELVKHTPGSIWHNDHKYWTIPLARLGMLLNQFKGTPYESQIKVYSAEHIEENATLDATGVIPDVDLTGIPLYVEYGSHLYQHQLDFMKFAIDRQRNGLHSGFILADQPGLGKTLEVTNLALYNKKFNNIKHCLIIVCKNSAKYNWLADIKKHTNGQEIPYLLGSRIKKRSGDIKLEGSGLNKLDDLRSGHMYGNPDAPELPFFIIMNIEAIQYRSGKHYAVRECITSLINDGYIGMVAIDECHRNASAKSTNGKCLLQIKRDIKRQIEWIPMTGTPIVNKPTDVFLPLKLVDGHTWNKFYDWCQHFCIYGGFGDHHIIANKNIPELKQMLQLNMLRRLKKDVLDLPPKLYELEYIENTDYQKTLYEHVAEELKNCRDDMSIKTYVGLRLIKLRQVTGSPELIDKDLRVDKDYLTKNAKLVRLLDLVDTIVSSGEKVIIFSNWVEPLRTIYKFLAREYQVCCYTGTMKPEIKEQHKQRFQTDPNAMIMIGTVDSLGESHTLVAANNIIFYDLPWNPATMEQAIDRVHRIGATRIVNIYSLIARGTVDEVVYNIIMRKEGMAKYIVDNELSIEDNPQLLEYLLMPQNFLQENSM